MCSPALKCYCWCPPLHLVCFQAAPHEHSRTRDGCQVKSFWLVLVDERTFKLLSGLVKPPVRFGAAIKGRDGKLVTLKVEELEAGWDATNAITYTFSQELCDELDDLTNSASTPTNQQDAGVCLQSLAPAGETWHCVRVCASVRAVVVQVGVMTQPWMVMS